MQAADAKGVADVPRFRFGPVAVDLSRGTGSADVDLRNDVRTESFPSCFRHHPHLLCEEQKKATIPAKACVKSHLLLAEKRGSLRRFTCFFKILRIFFNRSHFGTLVTLFRRSPPGAPSPGGARAFAQSPSLSASGRSHFVTRYDNPPQEDETRPSLHAIHG